MTGYVGTRRNGGQSRAAVPRKSLSRRLAENGSSWTFMAVSLFTVPTIGARQQARIRHVKSVGIQGDAVFDVWIENFSVLLLQVWTLIECLKPPKVDHWQCLLIFGLMGNI